MRQGVASLHEPLHDAALAASNHEPRDCGDARPVRRVGLLNWSVREMPWRRYPYKTRWEHARDHVAAAGAFSSQVDGTDRIVKQVFFRLSGPALVAFFNVYRRRYGRDAAAYAEETRERWRRGEVRMSGLVSERLYAIIPPFMSSSEKREVVETLWRRYAARSRRYLYFGPKASTDEVMERVRLHFDALLSVGNLPLALTSRFEWLTDNDAVETRRLVGEFVRERQTEAFTAARVTISVLLAAMQDGGKSTTSLPLDVVVGNHTLSLKPDRRRDGVIVSDSPTAYVRSPSRIRPGGAIAVAVIIIVLFIGITSNPRGSSSTSSGGYAGGSGSSRGGYGGGSSGGFGTTNTDGAIGSRSRAETLGQGRSSSDADNIAGGAAAVNTSKQTRISEAPTSSQNAVRSSTTDTSASHLVPPVKRPLPTSAYTRVTAAVAPSSRITPAPQMRATINDTEQGVTGCASRRIARVGDAGSVVDLDDGARIAISTAGIMRIQAASWATGDNVTVCIAASRNGVQAASVKAPARYQEVQGHVAGFTGKQSVSCAPQTVRSMGDDGASLQTADGATYEVSENGIMRIQASQWSTGDAVTVCTAHMRDGAVAAGLTNPRHYSTVQALRTGIARASSVTCREATIVDVGSEGESVALSDNRLYRISDAGIMRIQVQQWTTGEVVRICSSTNRLGTAASLENRARYSKVQAIRV